MLETKAGGGEVTEAELETAVSDKAKIWTKDDWLMNPNPDFTGMKVGDVLIDVAYDFSGIISANNAWHFTIRGNDGSSIVYDYNKSNNEWENYGTNINTLFGDSDDDGKFLQVQDDGTIAPVTLPSEVPPAAAAQSGGGKLYRHKITLTNNDWTAYLTVLSTDPTPTQISNIHTFLGKGESPTNNSVRYVYFYMTNYYDMSNIECTYYSGHRIEFGGISYYGGNGKFNFLETPATVMYIKNKTVKEYITSTPAAFTGYGTYNDTVTELD